MYSLLDLNWGNKLGLSLNEDGVRRSGDVLLGFTTINFATLTNIWPDELAGIEEKISCQLEIDALYRGYLERQQKDIDSFKRDEALTIPDHLDFSSIPGLSAELVEKFNVARPATLGSAARIAGVTPSALMVLLRHIKRNPAKRQKAS